MKSRLVLNFSTELADTPVTFSLVKDFGLSINILKAEILPGRGGELLIEVEGTKTGISQGVEFLQNKGVIVEGVEKRIKFKDDDCVSCGACTAVCFSDSLIIKDPDWKLEFDSAKCVVCGLCVKACPLKLFDISFGV
jgi:L-aspartate semialdehyde sulfurtransferase ferredoxin